MISVDAIYWVPLEMEVLHCNRNILHLGFLCCVRLHESYSCFTNTHILKPGSSSCRAETSVCV